MDKSGNKLQKKQQKQQWQRWNIGKRLTKHNWMYIEDLFFFKKKSNT